MKRDSNPFPWDSDPSEVESLGVSEPSSNSTEDSEPFGSLEFGALESNEEANPEPARETKHRAYPFQHPDIESAQRLADVLFKQIALERSHEAFDKFYDLLSQKVFWRVMRVLDDAEDSRDIVQEAFAQFWEKAPEFYRSHTNSSAWIFQLARRRAIDETRSSRFRTSESFAYDLHDTAHDDSTEELTTETMQLRLEAALVVLSPMQREMMQSLMLGKSYREIAEQMHRTEDGVARAMQRAYQKLRPVVLRHEKIVPYTEPGTPRLSASRGERPQFNHIPELPRDRTTVLSSFDFVEEEPERNDEQDALLRELEQLFTPPASI